MDVQGVSAGEGVLARRVGASTQGTQAVDNSCNIVIMCLWLLISISLWDANSFGAEYEPPPRSGAQGPADEKKNYRIRREAETGWNWLADELRIARACS